MDQRETVEMKNSVFCLFCSIWHGNMK